MRTTEAHKRNLRHTKARVVGQRRYGKPEQRALRDYKREERRRNAAEDCAPKEK